MVGVKTFFERDLGKEEMENGKKIILATALLVALIISYPKS